MLHCLATSELMTKQKRLATATQKTDMETTDKDNKRQIQISTHTPQNVLIGYLCSSRGTGYENLGLLSLLHVLGKLTEGKI